MKDGEEEKETVLIDTCKRSHSHFQGGCRDGGGAVGVGVGVESKECEKVCVAVGPQEAPVGKEDGQFSKPRLPSAAV